MQNSIVFDPLISLPVLVFLIGVVSAVLVFSIWRRLVGVWLRAGAAAIVMVAMLNPAYQVEQRDPLNDVVFLVVDRTDSQAISDRAEQTEAAIQNVRSRVSAFPNTVLKVIDIPNGPDNQGSLIMGALSEAMADVPENQIAGTIIVSDGQIHDVDLAPTLKSPLHLLRTGHAGDWDRRLIIKNSPGFGILGEPLSLTLSIEDQGQVPETLSPFENLIVTQDGGEPRQVRIPTGQDVTLPLVLEHGGTNVIQLEVGTQNGELTDRNNSAVVQVNGVRDRLSVLLVSGEPYPGERTWRNLLKSDSSVDLVHFTILRPPQKQDQAPVSELALIAFPTRELFLEKIDDFDLIIFDRYRRRGILPSVYMENVRQYVESGGAVLVSAGPAFASAESLYRSPLGDILPAAPTSRLIETGFKPLVTDLGNRHPVSAGLGQSDTDQQGEPGWGRWFRLVDVEEVSGNTLMSGPDDRPLLVLDRIGEGRVALLASDHAWLWGRGFEGGGPQQELLRRLAHWMMKEPELEEESLTVTTDGQSMLITRQTLMDEIGPVEITDPNGQVAMVDLAQKSPGKFVAQLLGADTGLYRLTEGDQTAIAALGPSAPREFEETIATDGRLQPLVKASRGGIFQIENGVPALRGVRLGRVAAGRDWIGIAPRNAYVTTDVRLTNLLPAWLALVLACMLSIGAWFREGRR